MSNKNLVAVLLVSVVALSAPAMAAAPGQGTTATDHRVDGQLTDQPMSTSHQPDGAEQVAAPDQFEPNDDFNNSTTVEPGTYSNLSIESADVDVYGVSLERGEALSAAIAFSHAEGDLEMALVGPDQETVVAASESTTDNESVSTVAAQNGTYYLVVYGHGNATGTYDLTVSVGTGGSAEGDAFEPNDDVANATTLEDGTYENLSVTENDIDVYAVSLDTAEALTASIEFSHAEGDLDMALLGGDPLQAIDASVSTNDSESISSVAPESGTYYLVVYGFENATAPYNLSLTTASGGGGENATTGDAFEPNDDVANATALEAGNYTNLSIGSGDVDVFTVDAATDSVFAAAINFSHAEGDLDMALVGPNQTTLASSTSTTDGESITTLLPETGTYYLVVYGFENATADYDLLLTFTPSETETETANNTTAVGTVRLPVVD